MTNRENQQTSKKAICNRFFGGPFWRTMTHLVARRLVCFLFPHTSGLIKIPGPQMTMGNISLVVEYITSFVASPKGHPMVITPFDQPPHTIQLKARDRPLNQLAHVQGQLSNFCENAHALQWESLSNSLSRKMAV